MQTENARGELVAVAIKTVPFDDNFEEALISHERYAFGRHSYLPPYAIAYIKHFLPDVSYKTLTVFRDDIDYEFKRYERMNWQLSYRKEWKELLDAVREEIEKRKETTNNA